jgi:peptide/nickel transport system permease protein
MGRYAAKRLLQAVPILALVSLISFGIMKLVPGDPAVVMAGPGASPEDLNHLRQTLGLDKPFLT